MNIVIPDIYVGAGAKLMNKPGWERFFRAGKRDGRLKRVRPNPPLTEDEIEDIERSLNNALAEGVRPTQQPDPGDLEAEQE